MAKKRKDKKFSKTKLRPRADARAEVNRLKVDGMLPKTVLNPLAEATKKAFSDITGDPAPPEVRAVRYAVFPKGVGVVYVRPGENTKDRIMQIDFTQTPPKGQPELNDSLRAVMEKNEAALGGVGDPPGIIAVSANASDEDAVSAQLQQLVDDMNEEARGDKTKPQYSVRLVSSSIRASGLFGKRQVKLRYELTPVAANVAPPAAPLMSSAELRVGLGKDDKLTGSRQYRDLLAALDAYHGYLNDNLDAYTQSLNNNTANLDDLTRVEAADTLKNNLLTAANQYLQIHPRNTGGKKNATERLKEQLAGPNPLAKARQEAIQRLAPLATEAATQGRLLGAGANGEVRSKIFTVADRIPPGFEAAVKMDGTTPEATVPAMDQGIEQHNPQQSRRAVSAYAVDRLLDIGVIPETRFVTQPDENGALKLGQAMQVVGGIEGQVSVEVEIAAREVAQYGDMSDEDLGGLRTERDANGIVVRAWRKTDKMADVNYSSPILQKGLSDLQVLDNIIGAADRHPGNYIIETSGPPAHNITGIKGIDNDDAFGRSWTPFQDRVPKVSKTPDVPPLVDVTTAIKILAVDEGEFRDALQHLRPEEIDAAVVRLNHVKETMKTRAREGALASMDGRITDDQINVLTAAGAFAGMALPDHRNITQWGTVQAEAGNNENNSYLGLVRDTIQKNGAGAPKYNNDHPV